MAGMRKPLPVAWAVFDGIDRMHVAKGYSEAESCAEDIGGEIVPLYRAPRWIPVSERLPEKGQRIIVWATDGKAAWIDVAEFEQTYKTTAWATTDEHSVPFTHWMPLPEPPAN
jgi:hypothetical protein